MTPLLSLLFITATSAQSFSAIWTFLTLLLEDSRTWTVEYPKGGLGSGQPVMSEHRGESGKFGSCSKSELAANKAAGVFLQKGRCVGSSGAMNYLRWCSNLIQFPFISHISIYDLYLSSEHFLRMFLIPHNHYLFYD